MGNYPRTLSTPLVHELLVISSQSTTVIEKTSWTCVYIGGLGRAEADDRAITLIETDVDVDVDVHGALTSAIIMFRNRMQRLKPDCDGDYKDIVNNDSVEVSYCFLFIP